MTVLEAIEDFLTTCALREMSPGTLRGYRYDLGRMGRFLAARGVVDVERVRAADLRAFLRSTRVGPSARARYRASMRSLFRFLTMEAVVRRDVGLAVPAVARPHYLPRPLAPDQVLRLLAAVDDLALRRLLTLVAETGLRISEAIHLQVEDVRLAQAPEDSWVRVVGKGRRERVLPLLVAPLSHGFLPEQLGRRAAGPVFGTPHGDALAPYTYHGVRRVWRRACAAAGVGHVRIHQLRHTFATRLVAGGVPIVTVQKLLGHQSLDTTMRYAAVTDSLVRRDLEGALERVVLAGPRGSRPGGAAPDAPSGRRPRGAGRTPGARPPRA